MNIKPVPVTGNGADADVAGGVVVERKVLRDGVYDAILEMLLSGQVRPGQSLGIDGLARELGVSPTPVREALGQLEHTGLVSRAALKGYRAAPPLTRSGMAELMDARSIIEIGAVRQAVPLGRDMIVELDQVTRQHRSAAQRVKKAMERHPDQLHWALLRKYYTFDWNFHLVFLRGCHNSYLLDIAERLAPTVHRLRQSLNHGAVDVDQAVAEHAVILEAARGGDPELTVAAMAAHLTAVRERALLDG